LENPVAVSPRLMTLRLKLSSGYLTVLSAYAPNLTASSEEKDAFYDHLSRSISLIRRVTVVHLPVTSTPVFVQIIPPGPVHLLCMEWGT